MSKQHRWTHATPRIRSDGQRIEEGDIFRPTQHEQRVWPDRMELQPTCAATKTDGRPCTRAVDEEGGLCWQHAPDDEDEDEDEDGSDDGDENDGAESPADETPETPDNEWVDHLDGDDGRGGLED